MNIYHITSSIEWENALLTGYYRASSLDSEGFIHCSTRDQVLGVGERYYHGISGLVLLKIDSDKCTHEIKFEDTHSIGELFPHLYGPLPVSAVVSADLFTTDANGVFQLPG